MICDLVYQVMEMVESSMREKAEKGGVVWAESSNECYHAL